MRNVRKTSLLLQAVEYASFTLLWPWKAFLLALFSLRLESLIELALIRSISIRYRRASASQVMSLVLGRLLLL